MASSFDAARDRVVLEVGPATYRWQHAEALARRLGTWQPFEQQVRAGLVALAAARSMRREPSEDEVRKAGRAFRRGRMLLSAEDLERWLADRRLTVGNWRDWLRRDLARRRNDVLLDEPVQAGDVDVGLWVDGVCTGRLAAFAESLAIAAALFDRAAEVGAAVYDHGVPAAEALIEGRDRTAAAAQTSGALRDVVREHRLEWTLVCAETLVLETPDAAREAAAVLDEGRPVEEVAALAGAGVDRIDGPLEEIPESLRSHLLASAPGSVVGPVETAAGWRALRVVDRRPPSLDEPTVRAAARRTVQRRLADREVAARVTWHERV